MSDVEWDDILPHLSDADDDLSDQELCDAGGGDHGTTVALRRVGEEVVVAAEPSAKRQYWTVHIPAPRPGSSSEHCLAEEHQVQHHGAGVFLGINRDAGASKAFSLSHKGVRRVRILACDVLEQSDMAMMNQLIQKWRGHAPYFVVGFAAFDCTTESVCFPKLGLDILGWQHLSQHLSRSLWHVMIALQTCCWGPEAVGADGVLWRTFYHLPQFTKMRSRSWRAFVQHSCQCCTTRSAANLRVRS